MLTNIGKKSSLSTKIGLICIILLITASPSNGGVSWSEDFESATSLNNWYLDGYNNIFDTTYNGKTFEQATPKVDVENGKLVIDDESRVGSNFVTMVSRDSQTAYGSWSWTLESHGDILVHFILNDLTNDFNYEGVPGVSTGYEAWQSLNRSGYALGITSDTDCPSGEGPWACPGITLFKNIPGSVITNGIVLAKYNMTNSFFDISHQYTVNRAEDGTFSVYVDDVLVLDEIDEEYTSSTRFIFEFLSINTVYVQTSNYSALIDNIEVTGDPQTTGLNQSLLIGGGVVLIAIFGIWSYFRNNQKKNS